MKLRAIELANIRRFAGQRARLSGLGDGLTVLSEPNEFGKSTFFDALHAVFFERHRAMGAPVKALRPHAGGAPEVTVEIELPEGRFAIFKRWLSRPQARITDAQGRIVAQDDEAEAWIDALMGGTAGGGLAGPSGLVWVRQGLLGLEPEGTTAEEKRARERGLNTRRDLLSSVAGEIEAMTGGRRMDAVVARVSTALAVLATATGKPKAGGAWAAALAEVEALEREIAALRPRAERLSGDLARRSDVQRQLTRLTHPEEVAARDKALKTAKAAQEAAKAHAAQLAQAETALRLAQTEEQAAQTAIDRLAALEARLAALRDAQERAQEKAQAARARAEDLGQRESEARKTAEAATIAARDLRQRLRLAQKARLAQEARARATTLRQQYSRAETLSQQIDAFKAKLALIGLTQKALETAEEAQATLDRLTAQAEAQAVQITPLPDGAAQALIDGQPLGPEPHPVLAACTLSLPGYGALHLDPGAKRGAETARALEQAQQARDRALEACGVESVAAMRALWGQAQQHQAALTQSAAHLADLAPEGLEALRSALARAEAAAAETPAAPEDPTTLDAELAKAETAENAAQANARSAQELANAAREARAGAEAERIAAHRAFEAAQAEAGDPQTLAARLAAARDALPARTKARIEKAAAHQALAQNAPDLATAEAALTRAQTAADQARQETEALSRELTELNSRIAVIAEEGIEETLAELEGRAAEAQDRAARYGTEVQALTRLRAALDAARSAARDAYFRPVIRELQPLLAILHPGAVIEIDDQSLLPTALTRDGAEESLDILSGGTREQLAILTRLAFARLFAQAGQAVPVILDDALVMSDDDRIEAMFTALHRVARDQQIIVFTCRQRAFAQLGGAKAQVTVDPL
ncbi:hypothetical protein CKO11_11110 [Rhodobacter sp. TJ_12]|uniref:AAA family ATPase n=1 Tax=Rhodobacter sp. TJ_12 TaxID=2029399 RepID=UPI001CBCA643|nr:ATP-binding protein [Rhodobacter sp. TJ_12]MBZ4023008.1 hypothetical protein [Rhodobacter sp. TJ_12]